MWRGWVTIPLLRIFSPPQSPDLPPLRIKMFKLHDIFQSPPNQKLQLSPGCIVSAQLSLKHCVVLVGLEPTTSTL